MVIFTLLSSTESVRGTNNMSGRKSRKMTETAKESVYVKDQMSDAWGLV